MADSLSYASGLQDALADGERVLLEYERLQRSVRRPILIGVATILIAAGIDALVALTASERSIATRFAVAVSIVFTTIILAICASRGRAATKRACVRLTSQHWAVYSSGSYNKLPLEDVAAIKLAPPQADFVPSGLRRSTEWTSLTCGHVAQIPPRTAELPNELAETFHNAVLSRSLRQRADERARRREARRRWQPTSFEDIPSLAMLYESSDESFATPKLLDGEQVVWTGRPMLRWGVDLGQHLKRMGRSALWTVGALTAVAAPFFADSRRQNPAIWMLFAFGALLLIGQISTLIVRPLLNRTTLRRTTYFLTNVRAISRERLRNGRCIEESRLIDAGAPAVTVTLIDDQRGDVRLGTLATTFFHVERPYELYGLALRVIQGLQRADPAYLPMPLPTQAPALLAEPIETAPLPPTLE